MKGQNVKKKRPKINGNILKMTRSCSQDATFRYMVPAELFPEQKPAARKIAPPQKWLLSTFTSTGTVEFTSTECRRPPRLHQPGQQVDEVGGERKSEGAF